jgi:hypothetical protein
MAWITFRCTSCCQVLRIGADKAGRKVRCRKCAAVVPIPTAVKETPDLDDRSREEGVTPASAAASGLTPAAPRRKPKRRLTADEDTAEHGGRRPRAERRTRNWRRVRLGLLLLTIAYGLAISLVLFGLVSTFVSWRAGFGTLFTMIKIGLVVAVGYALLTLAGYGFCLFVPPKEGARTLAVVALAVEAVLFLGTAALLGGTIWQAASFLETGPGETADEMVRLLKSKDVKPQELEALAKKQLETARPVAKGPSSGFFVWLYLLQVVGFVHLIIVPIFLRAVALVLKEGGIADNCQNLLKLALVSLGLSLASTLLMRIGLGALGRVFSLLTMVSLVLGVAYLGLCLVILIQLRSAIARRLD